MDHAFASECSLEVDGTRLVGRLAGVLRGEDLGFEDLDIAECGSGVIHVKIEGGFVNEHAVLAADAKLELQTRVDHVYM